jgi:hypothetical protein
MSRAKVADASADCLLNVRSGLASSTELLHLNSKRDSSQVAGRGCSRRQQI